MPLTTVYGITLTVEAALSTAIGTYGIWGTGLWDTATWGPDETWVDISQWVRKITVDRHFSREMQVWESGAANLELDNRDGRFSPANLTGPYAVGGITGIRPWRPIRVRATWAGVVHDVYRGYALDWVDAYDPEGPDVGVVCTVPCADEWGSLARFKGLAMTPVGAGETSGARVHRILNNAGHTGSRNINPGNVTLQATDFSRDTTDDLKLTTESEGGAIFIAKAGAVTYEHNYALIENPRSNTIQATFGDGVGELPISDAVPSYAGDLLVNIAAFQRVGGTVQTKTNETSRALYEDARQPRTDLICETDVQAANLADFYVQRFGQPEQRISQIEITPWSSPARLWPQVLGREVRDLIRVNRRPPGGYQIIGDAHISGIAHDITDENWITKFSLWSASIYQGVGRWDIGLWDSAKWFF
jgi:hypothetical protein